MPARLGLRDAVLLVAIVVFGVYPQLMFKVLDPAVSATLKAFGG